MRVPFNKTHLLLVLPAKYILSLLYNIYLMELVPNLLLCMRRLLPMHCTLLFLRRSCHCD